MKGWQDNDEEIRLLRLLLADRRTLKFRIVYAKLHLI